MESGASSDPNWPDGTGRMTGNSRGRAERDVRPHGGPACSLGLDDLLVSPGKFLDFLAHRWYNAKHSRRVLA